MSPLVERRLAGDAREVLRLAVPAVLSGFVLLAYHWINQAWVGHLPDATTAAAALSVAGFTVWAFQALCALVGVGLTAIVGRYAGAGRAGAARYVAVQGLRWAVALAAVTAIVGAFVAPALFEESGVSGEAARQGVAYTRVFFAGGFATMAQAACDAVWRGQGSTRVPLLTSTLGLALNAILDPLFIFGWGPVAGQGVAGAAVATVLASVVSLTVALVLLTRAGHLSRIRPDDSELALDASTPITRGPLPLLDLSVGRRIGRVGLPVTANGLFFVGVYLEISRIVSRAGGDAAQAGLGVGLRGEQVAFAIGSGFAVAASVLVSRRLGASRPDAASRGAWSAAWLGSAGCLAWGIALWAVAPLLVDQFLPADHASPEARAHALEYWRIVAPCLAFQALEVVLDGAFGGAGMTIPPMVVSATLTAARIPLAQYAAFTAGLGVRGIWIVISATAALRGIVTAMWFSRGSWRRRTV